MAGSVKDERRRRGKRAAEGQEKGNAVTRRSPQGEWRTPYYAKSDAKGRVSIKKQGQVFHVEHHADGSIVLRPLDAARKGSFDWQASVDEPSPAMNLLMFSRRQLRAEEIERARKLEPLARQRLAEARRAARA